MGHRMMTTTSKEIMNHRPTLPRVRAGLAILIACIALSRGYSQVPALVNYQGRLAHPDGSPMSTVYQKLCLQSWGNSTNGRGKWRLDP